MENIEAVFAAGAMPFIPFKSNSTGAAGGLYEKMFRYYLYHQEAFLKHYHKRSNVESTFSMIKRKFGDFVRSRTETAMKNEVFAKIVCHNLCCLIQSHFELGVEANFWSKDELVPDDEPEAENSADPAIDVDPFQPVAPLMEHVPTLPRLAEPDHFASEFCWM